MVKNVLSSVRKIWGENLLKDAKDTGGLPPGLYLGVNLDKKRPPERAHL